MYPPCPQATYNGKKSKSKTKGTGRPWVPKSCEIMDAGILGCELRWTFAYVPSPVPSPPS